MGSRVNTDGRMEEEGEGARLGPSEGGAQQDRARGRLGGGRSCSYDEEPGGAGGRTEEEWGKGLGWVVLGGGAVVDCGRRRRKKGGKKEGWSAFAGRSRVGGDGEDDTDWGFPVNTERRGEEGGREREADGCSFSDLVETTKGRKWKRESLEGREKRRREGNGDGNKNGDDLDGWLL